MAYLYFYSSFLAFLLLFIGARGSDETPREGIDNDDEYFLHYVTRPDIRAPKYEVHIYDEDALAPGYWFIAPYENINKLFKGKPWEAPYIYDGYGELIWAGGPFMDYYMVNDFKVSRYNDTDMLTGIMFRDNAALFLNSQYELVKSVNWTSEWEHANMHEFHVIRDGTRALTITRNRNTSMSLEESRTVGYDGHCMVQADGFKEIDITVDPAQVLFEWTGIDHLDLKDSLIKIHNRTTEHIKEVCEKDWDIHHFNSVDKFANGDYLLSSKVHDTIYKVSHVDGSIVWRLGGEQNDFKMGDGTKFGDQHIPRIINETERYLTISMFANTTPRKSRGQILQIDLQDMKVSQIAA